MYYQAVYCGINYSGRIPGSHLNASRECNSRVSHGPAVPWDPEAGLEA